MINKSIGRQIAESIEEWIFQEVFKPGEQIKESHLAKKFGVSQSPVREALRILEERGFVTHKPNVGTTVVNLSAEEGQKIHDVRMILEPYALKLAKENITEEQKVKLKELLELLSEYANNDDLLEYHRAHTNFHMYIWELSGNNALAMALDKVTGPWWATYRQKVRGTKGVLGGRRTHTPLYDFLVGNDNTNPEILMAIHNNRFPMKT